MRREVKAQKAKWALAVALCVPHFALGTGLGCIMVRPAETPVLPRAGGTPALPSDPRVRAARLATDERAPFAGVLLNDWTWERVIAALRAAEARAMADTEGGR